MDVLIRDLPVEVHAELVRRAESAGMSLRSYLQTVLSAHVAVPSREEWFAAVKALGPIDVGVNSGADLVRAGREEDDRLVGR